MQVVLNLDTEELFIVDTEEERVAYLKKLLYNKFHIPHMENKKKVICSDSLLNWKCIKTHNNGYYMYYKTDIQWCKKHSIKIVPLELARELLKNLKYQHIVRINNGIIAYA
jgi:hypothetical protein